VAGLEAPGLDPGVNPAIFAIAAAHRMPPLSGCLLLRNLLFISHRIPYPLTKGEKIRAYNLITHFAKSYRVHLGCLIDDPSDWHHLPHLKTICADVAAFGINRRRQKFKALARVRLGRPLMLEYYYHAGLRRWVDQTLAATHMDAVYIYSSAMAPYALHLQRSGKILDMQDIDSEKWAEYAARSRFPMRAVWAREARTLLEYERKAAAGCDATLFVTEQETRRFQELAPESAGKLTWIEMGVDLEEFSPTSRFESPYSGSGPHFAFTGNMDYWPNADAAIWFATELLPALRRDWPSATFHIVGNRPGADVLALKRLPGVHVTGRVPDVRPYVGYADVSVSPLRMARGVQNKVLQAMAMGKPVVASPQAFEGIRAVAGRDLLVADGAAETMAAIKSVLRGQHPELGARARAAMEAGYAWSGILEKLDRWVEASLEGRNPE
jgi:sugar transferase (PEP-CTERM/EpsH1 system associated)